MDIIEANDPHGGESPDEIQDDEDQAPSIMQAMIRRFREQPPAPLSERNIPERAAFWWKDKALQPHNRPNISDKDTPCDLSDSSRQSVRSYGSRTSLSSSSLQSGGRSLESGGSRRYAHHDDNEDDSEYDENVKDGQNISQIEEDDCDDEFDRRTESLLRRCDDLLSNLKPETAMMQSHIPDDSFRSDNISELSDGIVDKRNWKDSSIDSAIEAPWVSLDAIPQQKLHVPLLSLGLGKQEQEHSPLSPASSRSSSVRSDALRAKPTPLVEEEATKYLISSYEDKHDDGEDENEDDAILRRAEMLLQGLSGRPSDAETRRPSQPSSTGSPSVDVSPAQGRVGVVDSTEDEFDDELAVLRNIQNKVKSALVGAVGLSDTVRMSSTHDDGKGGSDNDSDNGSGGGDSGGKDGGMEDIEDDDSSLPPLPRARLSADPHWRTDSRMAVPSRQEGQQEHYDSHVDFVSDPPPLTLPSRYEHKADYAENTDGDSGGVGDNEGAASTGQSLSLSTDVFQHFISPASSTASLSVPSFAFPLHSSSELEQVDTASRLSSSGIAAPTPPPPISPGTPCSLQLKDVEPYMSDKIVMSLWQRLCEVRNQIDQARRDQHFSSNAKYPH